MDPVTAAATRRIRVVLADDTADIRALLRLTLSLDGGFDVVAEAADGRQAIEMVALHHPDILLLDLAMPVMGGLEAIPHVRRRAPDTKILVFSGNIAQVPLGRDLGADDYLDKGTPPEVLVARLRRLLPSPRAAPD